MNKAKFFDYIRAKKYNITKDSVSGFDLILDEAVRRKTGLHSLSYILATTYWETGKTMLPVREGYFVKNAEAWRKKNLRYYPYYGRGYVQLTWDYNYVKAGKKLGVDFLNNPDLVMEPRYAVPILFDGMEEGWFTGKKLSDYIDDIDDSDIEDKREFEAARRIINGVDKKTVIANLALDFEAALKSAGYGAQKKFTKSHSVKVAAFAGIGGLGEPARELATQLEPLIAYSDYIKYLFLAASVVGIGAMLYSRWKAGE